MSSGVEVPGSQRRPGIWSYFSFPGPRRRVSVTLPRNFDPNRDADPFEKPDRHSRHRSTNSNGFMGDYKSSSIMNQGQRLRYLKTGGVIAFILLALYFLAPRDGLSKGRQTSGHIAAHHADHISQHRSLREATRPRETQKQNAQRRTRRTSRSSNTPS
jgi:guanosine-diphosphatase